MSQVSSSKENIIIGDVARIVRRYAGALYNLAQEQSHLEAVAADVQFLRILLRESSEFQTIVGNPRLTQQQCKEALDQVVKGGKIHALTARFLNFLAVKRRLCFLELMLASFLERFAVDRGEHKAEVCSANPLTPAQQERLALRLQQLTGGKVLLSLSQDTDLLGGFRVKLGTRLIDVSVRTKLAHLERQLKSEQSITQEGVA